MGELMDLKSEIEIEWRIVEKETDACVTLFKKELSSKGMKIALSFHCQDTVDQEATEDEEMLEEEVEEPSGGVRLIISANKDGKNLIISCITRDGATNVDSVTIRDGDIVDQGFQHLGTENYYQGPEFYDLASDLQEAFDSFIVEECGVTESVSTFVSMYSDYKEQLEYVHWLNKIDKLIR